MHYLFGDSTPTQLTTNFIEFLRDAIDFCVIGLQTDIRIKDGQARAVALTDEAEAELEGLEAFIHVVAGTIERTYKVEPESPAGTCAKRLLTAVAEAHQTSANGIRHRLANDLATIDDEEAAAREPCAKALESLLLAHDPPDASTVARVRLSEDGTRYVATLDGIASFGLEWTIELAIPEHNLWVSPLHVSRIAQQMEIRAPQITGWISKEVKVKPQRIERMLVTELVDDRRVLTLSLRSELGATTGYDFELELEPEPRIIDAKRLGPAEDASVGAFVAAPEDVAPLAELASKLRAALAEATRRALVSARTGNSEFRAQPTYIDVVRRLLDMMAPITRELAERSLTPNELIMRRPLGNDRREEIFVSKALLREKYNVLAEPLRALFTPLGLEAPVPVAPKVSTPAPAPIHDHRVAAAPEPLLPVTPPIPSSIPPPLPSTPPPLPSTPPPLTISATPTPSTPPPARSAPPPSPPGWSTQRGIGPLPPARMPPRRPVVLPPPTPPSSLPASLPSSDAPTIEVTVEDDPPAPKLPSKPPSAFPPALPDGQRSNQELITELKRILAMNRNGQVDEAYAAFQELVTSPSFLEYRPEEQRQALRLMLVPKTKPPSSDAVLEAYRAALERVQALIANFDDASDYELLGVTQLTLDDVEAARVAFTTALGIERRRNPQSELVGTLMRRVSEI